MNTEEIPIVPLIVGTLALLYFGYEVERAAAQEFARRRSCPPPRFCLLYVDPNHESCA